MIISDSTNFREIYMGRIAAGKLYRSNHPVYKGKQVKEVILAASKVKIKSVINLCDNMQSLQSKVTHCPWYKKILDNTNAAALNISMSFQIMEEDFCKKIHDGIMFITEHEPPYLIHCEAGIDRTGFFSILLESFMGARIDDMAKDYMASFTESDVYSENDHRSGITFVSNLFTTIKGDLIAPDEDLQLLAQSYLRESIGINDDALGILKNKLAKEKDT